MKPVSTGTGPSSPGARAVLAWPPSRWSASNRVTSWRRASSQAAESPPMPAPTTAIRLRPMDCCMPRPLLPARPGGRPAGSYEATARADAAWSRGRRGLLRRAVDVERVLPAPGPPDEQRGGPDRARDPGGAAGGVLGRAVGEERRVGAEAGHLEVVDLIALHRAGAADAGDHARLARGTIALHLHVIVG